MWILLCGRDGEGGIVIRRSKLNTDTFSLTMCAIHSIQIQTKNDKDIKVLASTIQEEH